MPLYEVSVTETIERYSTYYIECNSDENALALSGDIQDIDIHDESSLSYDYTEIEKVHPPDDKEAKYINETHYNKIVM
jgi:hypothetical protein